MEWGYQPALALVMKVLLVRSCLIQLMERQLAQTEMSQGQRQIAGQMLVINS